MRNQPQKSKYNLKRSACMSFSLFLLVVVAVGCATTPTPPPPEQGQYLKVQLGQNTVSVPWSNTQNLEVTNQVTLQQIVDWTKQGVSSDEIISRIKPQIPSTL